MWYIEGEVCYGHKSVYVWGVVVGDNIQDTSGRFRRQVVMWDVIEHVDLHTRGKVKVNLTS